MNGEFEMVARLMSQLASEAPSLRPGPGETWIGDDAAVLAVASGWLLLAADTVVEGVHADLSLTGLDDLGWKVLAANVSDIAAMGGTSGHAVVAVSGPPDTDLGLLYSGLAAATERFGCPVVGGDLTNAPLVVVTVAVTGHAPHPVLRSGAKPGDGIWVTGPLGGAAAGLRSLRRGGPAADPVEVGLRRAHARPAPVPSAGPAAAAAGARAMTDVSDGLVADLTHLADASGVGVRLDRVPVTAGATEEDALIGGEDYVLVFCAPDDEEVARCFVGLGAPERIGVCNRRSPRTDPQGEGAPARGVATRLGRASDPCVKPADPFAGFAHFPQV